MNRYNFLIVMAIVLLLDSCQPGEPSEKFIPFKFRPNIVWITCEDMSPHLGCYGDSLARTPALDKLAREGVRYTQAFSVSGVCAPSRSALITGMYPTTTGAMHMRTMTRTASIDQIRDPELLAIPTYEAVPSPEVKCFPEYLRMAGYYCTNNSKEDYQFRAPVTAWDESSNHAHWKNRDPGQPFFAVFNIMVTHESQVWRRAGDPQITDPASVTVPPYYPDTPLIRKDIARHYDNIALMDEMAEKILEELENSGLMDSTIVFFFSDHGDGLPRAKRWIYDSGIRVPLIVRYPDLRKAGKVTNRLVSFIDFGPTVLSLADIPVPSHLQGEPFAGSQERSPRRYIFAAKDRMDPAMDNQRAVRDQRFKYIRNYMPDRPYVQFLPYRDQMTLMQELFRCEKEDLLDPVQMLWFRKTKPDEELYDTWEDPYEINNLAEDPDYSEILTEMRDTHRKWKEETEDWGLIPETELIKKIWPPEGIQPVTSSPEFKVEDIVDSAHLSLELSSSTEGASIGYQVNGERTWQVYHTPLRISETDTVRTLAHRIGYKPSEVVQFTPEKP
jgi:N-sulfoglucosamine sulfohydrolase